MDQETKLPGPKVPAHIWLLGTAFRTIFIVLLIAVTVRVSGPQIETVWSAYETPTELVRMALGFAVCVWLVFHIFKLPKDAGAYRIWLYLGIFLVPLAILCARVIW